MSRTPAALTDITEMKTVSLTNPSSSWITQTIINENSWVVITTTTTWSTITLANPSNLAEDKRFTVINNDTSTHTVIVHNMPIPPWTSKYFLWDWTAWTLDVWNIVGQKIINPSANLWIALQASNNAALTTVSLLADIQQFVPFRTEQEHTVLSIGLWYTVWVANNSIGLWLYESDERWFPTNLLVESGLLAATAWGGWTVTYTFPTPIVLKMNKIYWLTYACNQAWVTIRWIAVTSLNNLLWLNGNSATTQISRLTVPLSGWWTNFPNPAPTTWSYTYSASTVGAVLLEHKV